MSSSTTNSSRQYLVHPRGSGRLPSAGAAGSSPDVHARVLVVDDNEGLAELWALLLADEGYHVRTAATGADALDLVREWLPRVVLLDIQLPDVSGIGLLGAIGRLSPMTDCILVTGHSSVESAIDALNGGAYAYLQKPVSEPDMLWGVRRALERQRLVEENQRMLERERRIAETLQRCFLPEVGGVLQGLEVATLYRAALDEARIGGDFYDLFPLSREKTAVVIGDASGKGLGAAVATAMVRYGLRLCASEDPTPSRVIDRLNRFLFRDSDAESFVTLFYGVIDQETHTLTYANAGHEPVLLWRPRRGSTTMLGSTGAVVGAVPDCRPVDETTTWGPGSVLLLCTDGVTELRCGDGFLETAGVDALFRRHAGSGAAQPILDRLFAEMTRLSEGRFRDDVAMLLVRDLDPAGTP